MGALIGFAVLGIPCAVFLIWCLKKVVESESHDLRTGEGGLLKRDGVSGR